MKINTTILATALGLATFAALPQARADEPGAAPSTGRRLNTLHSDVAVRHRRLLVKNRLEFAPLFESTINADFRHIVGGGAKLEYHLSDMWSLGVIGVGSTALDTKLVKRIVPTLEPNADPNTREPSQDEFTLRLNEMPLHGAGYISLTPWYGKLAAFASAFVAFDFYFQAGVSFAQLKSDCPESVCNDPAPGQTVNEMPPDLNPNNDDPLNNGSRIGLYIGGGVHVFLNDFLALDLTVRDYAFADNPSGADVSGPMEGPDGAVTSDDSRFIHHLFFGAGVSIMFPMKAKRTN